jgi:hypothetical protein
MSRSSLKICCKHPNLLGNFSSLRKTNADGCRQFTHLRDSFYPHRAINNIAAKINFRIYSENRENCTWHVGCIKSFMQVYANAFWVCFANFGEARAARTPLTILLSS